MKAAKDSEKQLNMDLQSLNTSALSTEIKLLNLDVSTLLAYVTNMSNGCNNYIYREPLLTQQAEMERRRPIKPILEDLFRNKELLVSRTAYNNFMNIIDVIGGPKETQRAHELLKKTQIVDDLPTGRIMGLRLGGRIKDRSRLVFATGENMKSITVSANEGFVRAARMQVRTYTHQCCHQYVRIHKNTSCAIYDKQIFQFPMINLGIIMSHSCYMNGEIYSWNIIKRILINMNALNNIN
jgi:hypothetical protein